MEYQEYSPIKSLAPFVKCYWTLQGTPSEEERRQTILPDGCVDMAFILGDDVKRHISPTESIIQPRALVIGQITKPFYIEPCGDVDTFGVRFFPYGFRNFVSVSLSDLADRETAIDHVFDSDDAKRLAEAIHRSEGTEARINIVEQFLLGMLRRPYAMDHITKSIADLILETKGTLPIGAAARVSHYELRRVERSFVRNIGLTPKKLARAIRFQAALAMLIDHRYANLSYVAYESGFFDQAHFIRDFQYFTGATPGKFGLDQELLVSTLFSRSGAK